MIGQKKRLARIPITLRTSVLRSVDVDSLPEVLLLGFIRPTLTERAARVGQLLRDLNSMNFAIELIHDDDLPLPMGWSFTSHRVVGRDGKIRKQGA
jgi:hypothetical protein